MSDLMVRNQADVNLPAQARSNIVFTPRFDIWESEAEFVLQGDLPGVTPEGLEIKFENKELAIWGKVAPRSANAAYWAAEYGVGDYYRTFTLGEAVDAEAISAELKDGVLTVHLPKKPEARPRKIEVKAG